MAEEPPDGEFLCGAEEAAAHYAHRSRRKRQRASQKAFELHNEVCRIRATVERLESVERPRPHVLSKIEMYMAQFRFAMRCHNEHVDIVRQISRRQEELDNRVTQLRTAKEHEERMQQHRRMRRCMSLCSAESAGAPAVIRLQQLRAITSSQSLFDGMSDSMLSDIMSVDMSDPKKGASSAAPPDTSTAKPPAADDDSA